MCTSVLWNDNGLAVVVGRSMDWPTSTDPILTVLPRGLAHDGGLIGPSRIVDENPLTWTSTYGSLVTTVYGVGAADGLNERGLAAHMLYFKPATSARAMFASPDCTPACGRNTCSIARRRLLRRWPCSTICSW